MSEDIVFVCTADDCDAGPWEGSHDAMAHCSEHPEHGYTGRPRAEVDEVIPATATRARDNRNLQHKGHPMGALAQQASVSDGSEGAFARDD
ncbi:hypothetical protein GJ633_03100 [Halorubrum sp. CBA1125]|uniref:hypothetical protein n=1 Tax=Halorubrum sp. CBA1125 TaxID=2668072 RepID=UPI0012E8D1DC|nr:hypothetical protein [Halorubrum sp. CBA1125]MUW13758.1 hypothetical protein [Halorubrum sp. CBA1125]